MLRRAVCCSIGTALLAGFAFQTPSKSILEYPAPHIREEQKILIRGVYETWRLQWEEPPEPYCEPNDASFTCPCTGFAYGETGELFLVRLRNGTEIDRLSLSSFFSSDRVIVQRWEPDYEKDGKDSELEDFTALVSKRPTVQVMYFADYDHDGWKSEFYLQTAVEPCGKSVGVVIGVSKQHQRLHPIGTASNPQNPLYMQKKAWEALRDASRPIETVTWLCGDHGAETETRFRLHWTSRGIAGSRLTYDCPNDISKRKLISDEPLAP